MFTVPLLLLVGIHDSKDRQIRLEGPCKGEDSYLHLQSVENVTTLGYLIGPLFLFCPLFSLFCFFLT